MCPKAITSVFSAPKVEKPKTKTPTMASASVEAAAEAARLRQGQAVNAATNRIVTNDQLDDNAVQRPKLLGS